MHMVSPTGGLPLPQAHVPTYLHRLNIFTHLFSSEFLIQRLVTDWTENKRQEIYWFSIILYITIQAVYVTVKNTRA